MPHDDYQTYTSTTSSVTGARNEQTIKHTLSGRPYIKHVRGKTTNILFDTSGPRMLSGIDTTLHIVGQNFDFKNLTVYLSASVGTYTNHLSAASSFDLFSTHASLSAKYPAFTGIELSEVVSTFNAYTINHGYIIIDDNTLQLNISATNDAGTMEVVLANKAGYITLNEGLSGRIITITK